MRWSTALSGALVSGLNLTRAMSSSTKKPAGALIFLHGLGDTPAGWSNLETQLPRLKPRLAGIEYIFPAAPTIPISINGNMRMPGWFDLYDWPISPGVKDDRDGKIQAAEIVYSQVKKLKKKGIDKIVVGGFSQGGAIALLTAYHPEGNVDNIKFAGCAALSGWLTLMEDLKVSETAKEIPLFWGHGQYDDKVLFAHQAVGVSKLSEEGVKDIDFRHYPMGHESDPDELVALAEFVDRVIFEGKEKHSEGEL